MDQKNALNGQEAMPETKLQIEPQSQEQEVESSTSMESLLEQEGLGLDFPKEGEVRTGVIASIGENEILVSIGTKSEGVISAREIDQLEDDERDELAVGSEVLVYVVNPEGPHGIVQLSYLRALEERDWKRAEDLLESGDSFDSKIIGFNKGGLLVPLGRLRGFVPGSQVSVVRRLDGIGNTPEQRWGDMVGEPITAQVIEVDRERRRLILSERAALQETRETLKDRLLDELEEGDVRAGRVTSLADFGAFVNIDGADGLVHLSEISWDHIDHPKEVLKVGQEVKVKVINIDHDRKRIGLSIRQLQPDPWVDQVEELEEGQLVQGTITHLTKFGAFARLDEDLEGLIHISELSEQRVAHPKEVVREGDVVTLRVIKIEADRHRIGLSLRKVDSPKYTDFDWKTTLAEVVEDSHEGEEGEAAEPEGAADAADDVEETIEEAQAEALAEAEETVEEEQAEALDEAEETVEEESEQDTEQLAEAKSESQEEEPVKVAEMKGEASKSE